MLHFNVRCLRVAGGWRLEQSVSRKKSNCFIDDIEMTWKSTKHGYDVNGKHGVTERSGTGMNMSVGEHETSENLQTIWSLRETPTKPLDCFVSRSRCKFRKIYYLRCGILALEDVQINVDQM
jgi:hypothetical protein